jgi:fatty-acyl-CoA synthase
MSSAADAPERHGAEDAATNGAGPRGGRPPSDGATLVEVIRSIFGRWNDKTCVVDPASGVEWSYRDVAVRAGRWRALLHDLGLTQGARIAAYSGNSAHLIPAMLGVISGGYVFTPLNGRASVDDLCHVLRDAGVQVLLHSSTADGSVLEALRESAGPLILVPLDAVESNQSGSEREDVSSVTDASLAMLTYTGGTTGMPKGVSQSHRAVVQCLMTELAEWPWPRTPRLLVATPLSHGGRHLLLPTLWRGGLVVVLPSAETESIADAIRIWRVNCMFAVPSIMYRLLDRDREQDVDLASLEMMAYGGSPIDGTRLAEAIERWGAIFVQLYGQSEAPNMLAALQPEDHDLERKHLLRSCGRPILGVSLTIRDQDDHEAEAGVVGEICVRGRIVMDGYWNRPEETAAVFRDGWLRTGDLAYCDEDGYIYIVDRAKDMIITGGVNVFSREVEVALLAHPAVEDAIVIGVPDREWGEAVTAVVVASEAVSEGDLKAFVRSRKGPVHTPKTIDFVNALPLTELGKPDKKSVRERYWAEVDRAVN